MSTPDWDPRELAICAFLVDRCDGARGVMREVAYEGLRKIHDPDLHLIASIIVRRERNLSAYPRPIQLAVNLARQWVQHNHTVHSSKVS